MTIPLGVPELQRIEKRLEEGCSHHCEFLRRRNIGELSMDGACEEWLCYKITPPKDRQGYNIHCPCYIYADKNIILDRAATMLKTGRTID